MKDRGLQVSSFRFNVFEGFRLETLNLKRETEIRINAFGIFAYPR